MKKETEIVDLPTKKDINNVVEQIVDKWNELVTVVQNTTIGLCLMIKEMTKDYPQDTIKEILEKVKKHPDIKKFVSIDRVYQGLRLIRHRKDLIEYMNKSDEEKKQVPEEDKPYIKEDGDIFWEFYFELAKQNLSNNSLIMLEQEGKREKWSYRQLKEKIQETKEELNNPLGYESKKAEKSGLIKQITGICRGLNVEKLRGVLTLCKDFKEGQDDGNT